LFLKLIYLFIQSLFRNSSLSILSSVAAAALSLLATVGEAGLENAPP